MAEFINVAAQTVAVNGNVLFDTTVVEPCPVVTHRKGSGLFNIKGGHKFLVFFTANVAGATADTELDLAIALNGEALNYTIMASTPAVANLYNSISVVAEIVTPCNCCTQLSIKNVGTTAVSVANPSLVLFRED